GSRGRGAPRREDRDGGGAAVPGALRGGDGDPARHRSVSEPGGGGGSARATGRPLGGPAPAGGCEGREPVMSTEARGRRSGGRAARVAALTRAVAERIPFITRTMKPLEVLSEEGLELVEHNADTILEQV